MGMLAEGKRLTTLIEAEPGDGPQNNKMQLTSHGSTGGSQLILVLAGPRLALTASRVPCVSDSLLTHTPAP